MFDNLTDRLSNSFKALQGKNKLSEDNIKEAIREVRRSLLEADVALDVIKFFLDKVQEKSIGLKVSEGLTPSQAFIKLVESELTDIIGGQNEALNLSTQPPAVVMVAGLQGSGKTTTLYACLRMLNKDGVKILTAEDPVEYPIEGIVQVQISEAQGMTFGKALKSFLRQDPDIILVGEMRDLETAKIGIEASLTGHLVFTTLHTNDAPSTVLRLVDLGIETFLITATVEAIIAQRLVRRICVKCKEEYTPSSEELLELKLHKEDVEGRTFFRGKGCESCSNGYRGRLAIFEIMEFDENILILEGFSPISQTPETISIIALVQS